MRALFNYRLFARVAYALGMLILAILVGTVGYMLVEGWNLTDSFFMTIITISTVGFNEVHELSEEGQLFTAFLIITSFGTFAYAISAITTYLVTGEYKRYFKEYQVIKHIEKLRGHVIVCGYGRVGRQAVKQLKAHNQQYVVLEKKESLIDEFKLQKELLWLEGDATQDELLLKAGVKNAKALITTLPSDSDNLFVVLTAREINPTMTIISRASNFSSVKKLKIGGADNVIMPDSVGGSHMASLVVTPDVMEFLDHISVQGEAAVNLEEIDFDELPDHMQKKTIGELNAYQMTGCNIIGYRTASGEYVINPDPKTEVVQNSKLFVLGTPDQIRALNTMIGIE